MICVFEEFYRPKSPSSKILTITETSRESASGGKFFTQLDTRTVLVD